MEEDDNNRQKQTIGKFFLGMNEMVFDLLKHVGNNLLFTIDELSTLISFSVTGENHFQQPGAKEIAKIPPGVPKWKRVTR